MVQAKNAEREIFRAMTQMSERIAKLERDNRTVGDALFKLASVIEMMLRLPTIQKMVRRETTNGTKNK